MKKIFEKEFVLKTCCYSAKKINLAWNLKHVNKDIITLKDVFECSPLSNKDKLYFAMELTRLTKTQKSNLIFAIQKSLKNAKITFKTQKENYKHISEIMRDNDKVAKIVFDTILAFK